MRRVVALLGALLAGCGEDRAAPVLGEPRVVARSPCPGSDEAFAFRALRLLHGRRPVGVRELALLASIVRRLDDAGLPGRTLVARGLARGAPHVDRWRTFFLDHLRVPRVGATAQPDCFGQTGEHGEDATLASFVRDNEPEAVYGPTAWTMADLLTSSLHLDDVTPLLRAQVLARETRTVGGNNVDDAALERAKRVFLGRGFEAAWLGRRLECVVCHHGGGSTPTDDADPRLDRTWPVLPYAETAVYGAAPGDEDVAYAAFRVHGFVDGPLRPWGWQGCGDFTDGRTGDLIGAAGTMAGPLPAGAHALDLEARLRDGFEVLRAEGLTTAQGEEVPEAALAGLVAVNLADAVWREATGFGLTLAHGQPRNREQRDVLYELADTYVRSGYSWRALVVAVATHPYLDLAEPADCGGRLPAILDAFAADNDAGDEVRRESAWFLLDAAAQAMGWHSPERWPLYGWRDERLMRALGAYFDESEPGHRGIDLVEALAWEASVGHGMNPGWRDGSAHADGDAVTRLVTLARADPAATVEELVLAVQDRVLQVPDLADADQRAAVAALIGISLTDRAADHGIDDLDDGLRRFAGALLNTPQFVTAGLPPPASDGAPRLVLSEASFAALCERHAREVLADVPGATWECREDRVEVRLQPEEER